MSLEQVDARSQEDSRPGFLSRMTRRIPFLHRADTQATQESTPAKVITEDSVNMKLRTINLLEVTLRNVAKPVKPEFVVQTREYLTQLGIEIPRDSVFTVTPQYRHRTGLGAFSVQVEQPQQGTINPVKQIKVHMSQANLAPVAPITDVDDNGTNVDQSLINKHEETNLRLLDILAETIYPSDPKQSKA